VAPAEFFKGRIVFLDSLAPPSRETPLGVLPQREAAAHATATLLRGTSLARPAPAVMTVGVLLLGMLVGHLCGRRPRSTRCGAWRRRFSGAAATVVAFVQGVWADPIVLVAAALGAFLLTTQFTFTLERDERERNRSLLQRFVAPQVVDELLDDPEGKLGLGGQRRTVCVLFADIRNFTQFAESHTPEQVIDLVNTYMAAMTGALHAHGGILDKYTGDGLMALFRVGEPAREDVERAVRAAIAIRDAAGAISARLASRGASRSTSASPALRRGGGRFGGQPGPPDQLHRARPHGGGQRPPPEHRRGRRGGHQRNGAPRGDGRLPGAGGRPGPGQGHLRARAPVPDRGFWVVIARRRKEIPPPRSNTHRHGRAADARDVPGGQRMKIALQMG
jgi:hypothetical protein